MFLVMYAKQVAGEIINHTLVGRAEGYCNSFVSAYLLPNFLQNCEHLNIKRGTHTYFAL